MNITQLKEEVAKGTRAYKAFSEGEEMLSAIQGLEQFEKETQQRIVKLQAEETSLKQSVAGLAGKVDAAKEQADLIVQSAKMTADNILEKADADIAAQKAKANDAYSAMQSRINGAQTVLADLLNKTEDAKKELADITEKHNEIQTMIKSALKG